MIADDVMTRSPVAIDVTAPVSKAVALLASLDIRHLPVVDTSGALVGLISDRDVYGEVTPDAAASTVMSAPVHCAHPDADIKAIAKLMIDHKIGAVPIVDAKNALVGIVSYIDILRSLTR
jgi:acetoin utilization protein AcuB